MNKPHTITIRGKGTRLPIYFPDATKAVVRGLDFEDLLKSHVEGVVLNTYHLIAQPGSSVIKAARGIQMFMHWDGVTVTDSGGFQFLSLIYRDPSLGKINDNGLIFYKKSDSGRKKHNFTPEKSIQTQFAIGSDIMICLDDCPPADADRDQHSTSVERTIAWAQRCKEEFQKQIDTKRLHENNRPFLFAVIQGGDHKDLRKKCAESLMEIGFDGYGFGGWPLTAEGVLNEEIVRLTAGLTPDTFPRFALGIGNPKAIVDAFRAGYSMFDCVLPTRDARHKRIYTLTSDPAQTNLMEVPSVFRYLYIADEKYVRDTRPICDFCDCYSCRNFTRSYLHHLFEIKDTLAGRLATIHNLRVYTSLIENIRKYGQ